MMEPHLLLRLPPLDAVRELLQPQLKDGVLAEWFVLDSYVTDTDKKEILLNMRLDQTLAPIDYWHYSGVITIKYNRLDMDATFKLLNLKLKIKPPLYIRDVMDIISRKTGIVFDDKDFVDGYVSLPDTTKILIQSTNSSLRWYGKHELSVGN